MLQGRAVDCKLVRGVSEPDTYSLTLIFQVISWVEKLALVVPGN